MLGLKRNIVIPRQSSLVLPAVTNPFAHRIKLTFLDVIKIAIMSVTIAPIRFILASMCLVTAWILVSISLACISEEEKKQPLSGFRNWFRPFVVLFCRGVFFFAGFHWITVKGKRVSAKEAPVLVLAPHSSYFDALSSVFMDLTTVVAKAEAEKVPFFGTLVKFTQPVLVRRENSDSRLKTIREIQRRGRSNGKWPQIFIFPEGTCTNRSCLISYKPGAFYPGVPVQPVCLRYPNKLDTITWTWDGPSAFTCLWLTLCQFHNYMEIEFLPVYVPNFDEKNDPKLYANNVRKVMAECLQCPITDHTYDDCRLMKQAQKLKLPMATGLVEFQKVHKKLGLSYDQIHDCLETFHKIVGKKQTRIKLDEFAQYLHLPKSTALEEVFALYDRSGIGSIDFREYIIGISLISEPANTEDTLKMAFKMFQNENDYIIEEDFSRILSSAFKMDADDIHLLFTNVDTDNDGKISYDDFTSYATLKPEYAKLFTIYQDLKREYEQSTVQGTNENHVKTKSE